MKPVLADSIPVSPYQELDRILHPRSVAVIGASPESNVMSHRNFLRPLVNLGFKGPIYPVNPKGGEILGLKVYPSIKDVPGPVDLVIVCIPAPLVPQLLEECVSKEVKAAHLFTSDFGEGEDEAEGKRRADQILNIARRSGMRLIGPNCMGIYCPSWGIGFGPHFTNLAGPVGVFSQSGGNARELVEIGMYRGLHFSKVVSYGNAIDLNESDFLQYFLEDPETKVIAAYMEGVKSGPQFASLLEKATRSKPVIVLKGGNTEGGARAVASHTGSLAGTRVLWESLFKQAGAMQVHNLDEMADLLMTCLYMPLPLGKRAGVVGAGGGISVQAADDCEREGLIVPAFSPQIRIALHEFTPGAGSSVRNPVDSPFILWSGEHFVKTMKLLTSYEDIDMVILHMAVEMGLYMTTTEKLEDMIDTCIELKNKHNKPLAVVLRSIGFPETSQILFDLAHRCLQGGLPVYPTMRRAARAIGRYMHYRSLQATRESTK